MSFKYPICPERIRKVPSRFSWLDHRLVRERYIDRCSPQAAALYLFLVTVSDAQGLSYYSDPSLMDRLSMDETALLTARRNLICADLIAYQKPLCQVLALGDFASAVKRPLRRLPMEQPQSLGEIMGKIMEGAS